MRSAAARLRPAARAQALAAQPARAWRVVSWRNGTHPIWRAGFCAPRVTPTHDWRDGRPGARPSIGVQSVRIGGLGARPFRRALEVEIVDPLSRLIAAHRIEPAAVIEVASEGNLLGFYPAGGEIGTRRSKFLVAANWRNSDPSLTNDPVASGQN